MSEQWSRLRLSDEFTNRLRNVKGRTGLTPNLLCRIGFCLSLREPRVPNPDQYPEDGQELNRTTLVGEWDELIEALLRNRLLGDGLEVETNFLPQLRAHMNRGADLVCTRIRSLPDVLTLVPRET